MFATGREFFDEGKKTTPLAIPSGETPMGLIASEAPFRPTVSR
jgi:hypothetical protein